MITPEEKDRLLLELLSSAVNEGVWIMQGI